MELGPEDKERLIGFYRTAFKEYGIDARSLHWISRYNQLRRFDILCRIADLNGRSVLDAGCGLGDLCQFLLDHNIDAKYTGIDIMPDFIEAATKRFPDAIFETGDIFSVAGTFDYVLASGLMTFKVRNNENFYFDMIRGMYEKASKGVAFNMLDKATHADNETYASYSPQEVSAYCETFCPNVQVSIGYMPDDFTVYLYK